MGEHSKNNHDHLRVFMLVFVIGFISIMIYFYLTGGITPHVKKTFQETMLHDIAQIVTLPEENPIIRKVVGKTPLVDKYFETSAKEGDYLILFPIAQKALLYRPSNHKVIDFSEYQSEIVREVTLIPTFDQTASVAGIIDRITTTKEATSTAYISKHFTLALYNGTKIVGLTKKVEQYLKEKKTGDFQVVTKGDARGDFTQTHIFSKPGFEEEAQRVSVIVNGVVGAYPEKETISSADVVVFLGQDYP